MKRALAALGLAAACTGGLAVAETRLVVDGSTTVGPIAKALAEWSMREHPGLNITVSESGSGNGVKSLLHGACDVATLSRALRADEREAAARLGIQVAERVIAMDGLAVVVHPGNPLRGLTRAQLRAIYAGEIRRWSELGGPDLKIVVMGRDANSGTCESFQTLVMETGTVTETAEVCGSNGQVRQRVMGTPGAIGYVGLAFVRGLKPLAVDGVAPGPETVQSREYSLSRPLYFCTRGEPVAGTPPADFVNLVRTAAGRQIIEAQGFVPVE